ncbi:SDR family NAD(P)-dependent oxidoreductase [Escherichia coli]|uniref:SDR family NAD(P)-dependent oxidoreductase n=1 Tax=Citrobacter sp. Cb016 TaxID=2985015 RepID=UPI002580425D|nr:SDR family NAD(P)-dependent oxidoreductase [Citrobacter sp. Cb016]ELX9580989.1 SDR family NAD(P)-dependent oxidoreductase [Escherichia coli]MDM3397785.1 SDR family NAD(P)-dependent oxidoreductase [Citrobacter sp. Cb016]
MNSKKRRIVIIGATSAIAEQCARIWAMEEASEIVLVGRNILKTDRVADDLRIRSIGTSVQTETLNFVDPNEIHGIVDKICAVSSVDIVLIAHGILSDQQLCQNNLRQNFDSLQVNGISPVLFAEAFAKHMEANNSGIIAVIGSVAGDRGRKSNYVYGASKGLIERYIQGLQHRLASTGVKVVLIKPGPTDTPMTAHLKKDGGKLALASVDTVAKLIVAGIAKRKNVIYAPGKWQLIMLVIKHLPSFIFNKMDI